MCTTHPSLLPLLAHFMSFSPLFFSRIFLPSTSMYFYLFPISFLLLFHCFLPYTTLLPVFLFLRYSSFLLVLAYMFFHSVYTCIPGFLLLFFLLLFVFLSKSIKIIDEQTAQYKALPSVNHPLLCKSGLMLTYG